MAKAALMIVVGEPFNDGQKLLTLDRIVTELSSWDEAQAGCDLREELEDFVDKKNYTESGNLIFNDGERLQTYVLFSPERKQLIETLSKFLQLDCLYSHLVYAGQTIAGSGSWILQDDIFTFRDFVRNVKETDAVVKENITKGTVGSKSSVSLTVSLPAEWDWSRNSFAKLSGLGVKLASSEKVQDFNSFRDYVGSQLAVTDVKDLLKTSSTIGMINFSVPTLYIFPGGNGSSSLFGIKGFTGLFDGGYNRKSCFWDFSRHLQLIDMVMLTHLGPDNFLGMQSFLEKKAETGSPDVGAVFFNCPEKFRKSASNSDSLKVNLFQTGATFAETLNAVGLTPQSCYSSQTIQPITLYNKVGCGSVEMYVLNPIQHVEEMKSFLNQWSLRAESESFSASSGVPPSNMLSVSVLLVWKPFLPTGKIVRILFPGGTPQSKIFEGLDRLKNIPVFERSQVSQTELSEKCSSNAGKSGRGAQTRPVATKPAASKINGDVETVKATPATEGKELASTKARPDAKESLHSKSTASSKTAKPETKTAEKADISSPVSSTPSSKSESKPTPRSSKVETKAKEKADVVPVTSTPVSKAETKLKTKPSASPKVTKEVKTALMKFVETSPLIKKTAPKTGEVDSAPKTKPSKGTEEDAGKQTKPSKVADAVKQIPSAKQNAGKEGKAAKPSDSVKQPKASAVSENAKQRGAVKQTKPLKEPDKKSVKQSESKKEEKQEKKDPEKDVLTPDEAPVIQTTPEAEKQLKQDAVEQVSRSAVAAVAPLVFQELNGTADEIVSDGDAVARTTDFDLPSPEDVAQMSQEDDDSYVEELPTETETVYENQREVMLDNDIGGRIEDNLEVSGSEVTKDSGVSGEPQALNKEIKDKDELPKDQELTDHETVNGSRVEVEEIDAGLVLSHGDISFENHKDTAENAGIEEVQEPVLIPGSYDQEHYCDVAVDIDHNILEDHDSSVEETHEGTETPEEGKDQHEILPEDVAEAVSEVVEDQNVVVDQTLLDDHNVEKDIEVEIKSRILESYIPEEKQNVLVDQDTPDDDNLEKDIELETNSRMLESHIPEEGQNALEDQDIPDDHNLEKDTEVETKSRILESQTSEEEQNVLADQDIPDDHNLEKDIEVERKSRILESHNAEEEQNVLVDQDIPDDHTLERDIEVETKSKILECQTPELEDDGAGHHSDEDLDVNLEIDQVAATVESAVDEMKEAIINGLHNGGFVVDRSGKYEGEEEEEDDLDAVPEEEEVEAERDQIPGVEVATTLEAHAPEIGREETVDLSEEKAQMDDIASDAFHTGEFVQNLLDKKSEDLFEEEDSSKSDLPTDNQVVVPSEKADDEKLGYGKYAFDMKLLQEEDGPAERGIGGSWFSDSTLETEEACLGKPLESDLDLVRYTLRKDTVIENLAAICAEGKESDLQSEDFASTLSTGGELTSAVVPDLVPLVECDLLAKESTCLVAEEVEEKESIGPESEVVDDSETDDDLMDRRLSEGISQGTPHAVNLFGAEDEDLMKQFTDLDYVASDLAEKVITSSLEPLSYAGKFTDEGETLPVNKIDQSEMDAGIQLDENYDIRDGTLVREVFAERNYEFPEEQESVEEQEIVKGLTTSEQLNSNPFDTDLAEFEPKSEAHDHFDVSGDLKSEAEAQDPDSGELKEVKNILNSMVGATGVNDQVVGPASGNFNFGFDDGFGGSFAAHKEEGALNPFVLAKVQPNQFKEKTEEDSGESDLECGQEPYNQQLEAEFENEQDDGSRLDEGFEELNGDEIPANPLLLLCQKEQNEHLGALPIVQDDGQAVLASGTLHDVVSDDEELLGSGTELEDNRVKVPETTERSEFDEFVPHMDESFQHKNHLNPFLDVDETENKESSYEEEKLKHEEEIKLLGSDESDESDSIQKQLETVDSDEFNLNAVHSDVIMSTSAAFPDHDQEMVEERVDVLQTSDPCDQEQEVKASTDQPKSFDNTRLASFWAYNNEPPQEIVTSTGAADNVLLTEEADDVQTDINKNLGITSTEGVNEMPEDLEKVATHSNVSEDEESRSSPLASEHLEGTESLDSDAEVDPVKTWDPPMGLPAPMQDANRAKPKTKPGNDGATNLSLPVGVNDKKLSERNSDRSFVAPQKKTSDVRRSVAPKPVAAAGRPEPNNVKENTSLNKESKTATNKKQVASAPAAKTKKAMTTITDAVTKPKVLKPIVPFYVDLTYIPGNGDPSFSDVDFFRRVRARYYVLSALEPDPRVLSNLVEGKQTWENKDLAVSVIPTYDSTVLHRWSYENAALLQDLKISLLPAANKCTIKLQEDNNECCAFRVEF